MAKITPEQQKVLDEMQAKVAAEDRRKFADEMCVALEGQIQRICQRLMKHTGRKIASVSVDTRAECVTKIVLGD
jgi:hypothetical protein